MRVEEEEGQAIVLVALAMGIFLLGAVGLAVDGSNLYSQRQMAQTAADAAAQAGIMSIFDGTNGAGAAGFSTSQFTCGASDARTPCVYANWNGFGGAPGDTVTISFPADSAAPGVNFSTSDPVHLIKVEVGRQVGTTLMRLLGPTATTVTATAMAAIVNVPALVPVLITHPTLSSALLLTTPLTICGGPSRSIQVNSTSASAAATGSSIDLSRAGPLDSGNCTTGTGGDFGIWGGSSAPPPGVNYGTAGKYVRPASPILDPLAGISPPPIPGVAPLPTALAKGTSGCPATSTGCKLYSPGLYTFGINVSGSTPAVFKPGIYYIQDIGGMACLASCGMYMATGFSDTGAGTTNTGWTGNMLVYNTGSAGTPSNAGAFDLGGGSSVNLTGSPNNSLYKGILFFQDRASLPLTHSVGGAGDVNLVGTVYFADPSQTLSISGHAGNSTLIQGDVLAGVLNFGGSSGITIDLNSTNLVPMRQVAMVN